jgi:hypothetical protein
MKRILGTLLFFSLIPYCGKGQIAAKTIPEFVFFRLNKEPFTNKNLETGKMSLFVFFDAGCEHCQHVVQSINKHGEELKKVSVYLISLDNLQTINGFMHLNAPDIKNRKNVIILQDIRNEFIRKFGPTNYPSIYLYSPNNQLMIYGCDERYMESILQKIITSN